MVNLFGHGYIGSHFAKLYQCRINDKNNLIPELTDVTDVLYLISTIDNYNVKINPYLDIETNLTTLIRVLENFKQDPKSKDVVFNFASSWFVYGDTDIPAKETSNCYPRGFYSITKRAAEQLLISYCETYGLKYRILRFANVIGSTDTKVSKKRNALTYILNKMKQHNPIDLYDNGQFIRDYIHVNDVCQAVNLIITNGDTNEIYNIGNGIPITFVDVINYIKKIGSTSVVNKIPPSKSANFVQAASIMYLDTTKLTNLGYTPKYSIFDIVDELFQK